MCRPLGVRPLAQVLAVRAEDLDAVVLAIAHEDAPVHRHRDAVGQEELAGPAPRRAPGALELARGRVLMHATVAVAIGDVEIALWSYRKVGRPVERRAGA